MSLGVKLSLRGQWFAPSTSENFAGGGSGPQPHQGLAEKIHPQKRRKRRRKLSLTWSIRESRAPLLCWRLLGHGCAVGSGLKTALVRRLQNKWFLHHRLRPSCLFHGATTFSTRLVIVQQNLSTLYKKFSSAARERSLGYLFRILSCYLGRLQQLSFDQWHTQRCRAERWPPVCSLA